MSECSARTDTPMSKHAPLQDDFTEMSVIAKATFDLNDLSVQVDENTRWRPRAFAYKRSSLNVLVGIAS